MSESDSMVFTYDGFDAGSELGRVDVPLNETRSSLWADVFGPADGGGDCLPQGILVSAMMEGSLRAFGPRPAGNIHAMQWLEFVGSTPKLGDIATVRVHVLSKEIKHERKWVTLGADVSVDEGLVMKGKIKIIWAA